MREASGRFLDVEPAPQVRVLCGDADRAPARVARPVLLAPDRHQARGGQGDRVRPEREGLRHLVGCAEAAGRNELDVSDALVVQEPARPVEAERGRDADVVLDVHRCRSGAAAEPVDGDVVGAALERRGDVPLDVAGGELDPDGHPTRQRLDLGHSPGQILDAGDVGEVGGRVHVGAGRHAAHLRDLSGDLGAEERPPRPGFAPWPILTSIADAARMLSSVQPK